MKQKFIHVKGFAGTNVVIRINHIVSMCEDGDVTNVQLITGYCHRISMPMNKLLELIKAKVTKADNIQS